MSVLREFVIKLTAKTDQSKLDRANRSLDKMGSTLTGVGIGFAAVAGTAYLFNSFIDSVTQAGDVTIKMSRNLGIAVDAMQKFQYAGNRAGVSNENMINSLKYLNKNMVEASEGTGTGLKAFKRLGISVKNANGELKENTEVFKEVADSIKTLGKEERVATLMDLFGRTGVNMGNMFLKGSEGVEALFEKFDKLNFAISEENLEAMEEYNDRTFEVGLGMKKLKAVIVGTMLPTLTKLREEMVGKFSSAIKWVEKNRKALTKGFEKLTKVLKYVGIGAALFALGKLTIALAGVASAFSAVGFAGVTAWAKALIGPLLLGGAVVAVGLLIDDMWQTYMNPEVKTFTRALLDSLENRFPEAFLVIKAMVNSIKLAFAGWGLVLSKVFGTLEQQKIWESMIKDYGGNVVSSTVDSGILTGSFKKINNMNNTIDTLSSPDFWPSIGRTFSSPDFWPKLKSEWNKPRGADPFTNMFRPEGYHAQPVLQGGGDYNINNLNVNTNAVTAKELARDIKTASKR